MRCRDAHRAEESRNDAALESGSLCVVRGGMTKYFMAALKHLSHFQRKTPRLSVSPARPPDNGSLVVVYQTSTGSLRRSATDRIDAQTGHVVPIRVPSRAHGCRGYPRVP